MRVSIRAAQAAALLIGFHLLVWGIIAALVGAAAVAAWFALTLGLAGLLILIVCVPAAFYAVIVVVQGVFVPVRFSPADLPGVAVGPDAEPELWARVVHLAQCAGTRGPHRVLIGTDAEAAVWEGARLLGLLPGRRYLVIGAPLLLALSPAQLDAVLAHEFGHYGNRDTRLAALVGRGRVSILATLRAAERKLHFALSPPASGTSDSRPLEPRNWWYFVLALRIYAHLFFSLTQAASRAQEYAADRTAARIAGREATVSALAELPVIAAAYQFYLEKYVYCGLPARLLPEPAEVIGGFASLIADPQRNAEFHRKQRAAPSRSSHRFDSHPPLPDRLAALRALPDDVVAPQDAAIGRWSAVEILRDRQRVLIAVGEKLLESTAAGTTRAGWAQLVDTAMFHNADRVAAPLVEAVSAVTGVPAPSPHSLLDAVTAGRLEDIRSRLGQGSRAVLADRLRQWVLVACAERGRVHWQVSWSQPAVLDAPPGLCAALDASIEALLGSKHDTDPLRAVLDEYWGLC